MQLEIESLFLAALLFTIAVETGMLFLVLRFLLKIKERKIPLMLIIFSGIFASFATLPYVWFVFPAFIRDYFLYVAAGEISVVFIEAAIYFFILKISKRNAFFISLVCNTASFFLGLAVF